MTRGGYNTHVATRTQPKQAGFIVFEGLDGSGKTTLARWAAEAFGFEYHKSPEAAFADARDHFDRRGVAVQDRLAFYLGATLRAALTAKEGLERGKTVVLDRYILSTLAYHEAMLPGATLPLAPIAQTLLVPDITFVVTASEEVRMARLLGRGALEANDLLVNRNALGRRIAAFYKEHMAAGMVEIDNSGALEDAQRQIRAVLEARP